MARDLLWQLLADSVLLLHSLFVVFIAGGLLLVLIGKWRGWHWVTNPWFRLIHLLGIGAVVLQSWAGVVCPLTTWEMALRQHTGEVVYRGSFIAHWLDALLYYRAPEWVFVVCYSAFGAMVALAWWWVRPRPFGRRLGKSAEANHGAKIY